jgi:hypothetical protein
VAAQLWLKKKLHYHGRSQTAAVATSNPPLSICADMTPTLRHEAWTHEVPQSTLYYCGVFKTDVMLSTYRTAMHADAEFKRAKAAMIAQLRKYGSEIDGLNCGIAENDLCADAPVVDRFEEQHYKLNFRPSDLCDIANVGSSAFRLNAMETGLRNMIICSTWTKTSINSSCVEAAVMSGLAAARALKVTDRVIFGERFFMSDE